MKKAARILIRFFEYYGKRWANMASIHGPCEPPVPKALQKQIKKENCPFTKAAEETNNSCFHEWKQEFIYSADSSESTTVWIKDLDRVFPLSLNDERSMVSGGNMDSISYADIWNTFRILQKLCRLGSLMSSSQFRMDLTLVPSRWAKSFCVICFCLRCSFSLLPIITDTSHVSCHNRRVNTCR